MLVLARQSLLHLITEITEKSILVKPVGFYL
jgi:hypothetical protein